MSGIAIVDRNDPFSAAPLLRSRRAADPQFDDLSSLETQTVRMGALAAGATTLYTVPAGRRARLGGGLVYIHNPTAGAITADLHHVPSGGASGSTNKMATTKTFAANEGSFYFSTSLWHVMAAGDALVINTGGANLNAWLTALEERSEICAFLGGFTGNLGTSDTALITVPGMRSFALKSLIAYNPTAGTRIVSTNMRASGAAAADSNQVAENSMLTVTGYTLDANLAPTLSAGGVLSARGDTAGINVWASGVLY